MTTYRVRIAWLDWTNESRWSEWVEVTDYQGTHSGGDTPSCLSSIAQSGFSLDEQNTMPINLGVIRLGFRPKGRYVPAHRITAVDWEETQEG